MTATSPLNRPTTAAPPWARGCRGPSEAGTSCAARTRRPRKAREVVAFTVTLSVAAVAAEYARLQREAANITAPLHHEPWGEQLLELTDPNGVVVQLAEWIPPAGS